MGGGKGGSENVGIGSSTPVIFQKVGVGPRQWRTLVFSSEFLPALPSSLSSWGRADRAFLVLATPP